MGSTDGMVGKGRGVGEAGAGTEGDELGEAAAEVVADGLGDEVGDADGDADADADADGDDNDQPTGGGNDEDGVDITQFDNFYDTNTIFSLDVTITNILGANSYLYAWIDFDRDGNFDSDEFTSLVVTPNTGIGDVQTLTWDVSVSGADVNFGKSFVRICRF